MAYEIIWHKDKNCSYYKIERHWRPKLQNLENIIIKYFYFKINRPKLWVLKIKN